MSHPVAEQARQALNSHLFSVARQLVNDAISRGENHPDILCEHLICESYFGNEESAATRFDETKGAKRTHDLQLLLSRYFYCRRLLAGKQRRADLPATDWLTKHPYTPESGVGIRISACLITRDESKNLVKCLDSLKGIVDEIVVVDTGSKDDTVMIAKKYGAIIGSFTWINDFAAARNESLKLATGEWALWIDADEQLDPTCATEFVKGIVRPHIGGYSIEIVNYLDDGGTTTEFIHNPTRLFRRIEGIEFTEPIHEQITPSMMKFRLPWTPLPGCKIHHDGYRQAALVEKNKVQRTLDILEGVVEKNPSDPFHLFNLANTYFVQADYAKTAEVAQKCVKYMPGAGAEYGHAAFQVLVTSLEILGRQQEALRACDQCDQTSYYGVVNEYLRASVLLNQGRFADAMRSCEKCLTLNWPDGCIGDKGIADFRRHGLHAQLLGCLGKWQGSLDGFDFALSRQPGFRPALMGRAVALENLERYEEAEKDYLAAITDPRQVAMCSRGLGNIAKHRGNLTQACTYFEQAWKSQLQNQEIWNEWATCATELGDLGEIDRAYAEYLEVHNPTAGFYVNWARAYEKCEVFDHALAKYQEAINFDPTDSNASFSCGDMLYRVGAFAEAAQVYEVALRGRMDFADGWFVLGNCMAQMDHDQAAIKCYAQALVLDPNHEKAQSNLMTVSQAA
jgi:tetratricopeptide (TPR) repeat protein